jgi:hypothetical protein
MTRGLRSPAVLALLALVALAASQFAWVRSTNSAGVDDWLILWLTNHGIVDFPYENRPLRLVWSLPAALLTPWSFSGFLPLQAGYLAAGAWVFWLLVRRLEPGATRFALLAAAFALVWAPLDMGRLAVVQCSPISGPLFGCLLALFLVTESWRRGAMPLVGLALAVAYVSSRSYEAVLGLLAGAPPLLAWARAKAAEADTPRGSWWRLTLVFELGVLALGALAASPLLGAAGGLYQREVLGLDLDPRRYAGRLAWQYALHLVPLWPADPTELAHVGVALAALVFLAGAWATRRDAAHSGLDASRGRLAWLAGLGLVLAGLGNSLLAASPGVLGAARTQFLSAPGIGLFLAAVLGLGGSFLPPGLRGKAVLAGAAAVIAVGTGHTLGMQREWDRIGSYPAQRGTLAGLVREAPALRPNTLLLLLDEDRTWSHVLSFRHAVALVYGDDVVGYSLESDRFLYDIAKEPGGLRVSPWPVIRGPWRQPPTFHRWDEVVLFRLAGGRTTLLDRWEHPWLPSLPAGARYAPRERITGGPVPPGRRALDGPLPTPAR